MIRLGNFNAVLDTCVLYDSLIRDLLLRIADRELYQPIWSNSIIEELEKNLIKRISPEKIKKLTKTLNEVFPSAMVLNPKEIDLKDTSIDKKDKHIVIAAICSNSQVIVTYNTKHFPNEDLKKFFIEAQTPDIFLKNILDLSFKNVLNVYYEMEDSYTKPKKEREQLLKELNTRVPMFTSSISPYLDGSITRLY